MNYSLESFVFAWELKVNNTLKMQDNNLQTLKLPLSDCVRSVNHTDKR